MKNTFLFLMILFINSVAAESVQQIFTYQGQLQENGSPINGMYSFIIDFYDTDDENDSSFNQTFAVTMIEDGLFNLEIDLNAAFGLVPLDGTQYWIGLEIKPVGSDEPYSALPRQKLNATPYALTALKSLQSDLAISALSANEADHATTANEANHATNADNAIHAAIADKLSLHGNRHGDILAWNDIDFLWEVQRGAVPSPWTGINNDIQYSAGRVTIGSNSNSFSFPLLVDSGSHGQTANFKGGDNAQILLSENDTLRGRIGSYTNHNDSDMAIGTAITNNTGDLQLTIKEQTVVTITHDEKVGIGETSPDAKLTVNGQVGNDIVNFNINDEVRFKLDDNGGVSIGADTIPPERGIEIIGNAQQVIASNGIVKAAAHVSCGSTASVIKQFMAVSGNTDAITVTPESSSGTNGICNIQFPVQMNTRFFQATAITETFGNDRYSVNCKFTTANILQCVRFNTVTGSDDPGQFMITIF